MEKEKIFSAEKKLLKERGTQQTSVETADTDITATILSMREEIQQISALLYSWQESSATNEEEELIAQEQESIAVARIEEQTREIEHLRMELFTLSTAIQDTKFEIANLTPDEDKKKDLNTVTEELDAIVSSTENATETILDCAEKIDDIAHEICAVENDSKTVGKAEEISEIISKIYEACNFQDLTGQRITKALKVLNFVEGRIQHMIEIWGKDSIEEIVSTMPEPERKEEGLELSGPANDDEGIKQEDIDALFD